MMLLGKVLKEVGVWGKLWWQNHSKSLACKGGPFAFAISSVSQVVASLLKPNPVVNTQTSGQWFQLVHLSFSSSSSCCSLAVTYHEDEIAMWSRVYIWWHGRWFARRPDRLIFCRGSSKTSFCLCSVSSGCSQGTKQWMNIFQR